MERKETPEERESRLAKDRVRKANQRAQETPEQRETRLTRDRKRKSEARSQETQKVHKQRIENVKIGMSQSRDRETQELRNSRLEKVRMQVSESRDRQTLSERNARLLRDRERTKMSREDDSPEQRDNRLFRDREQKVISREREIIEHRDIRQLKDRERAMILRDEQSPDQREARLSTDRMQKIECRITESQDVREIRLLLDREYHAILRSQNDADKFERDINRFCALVCEVCKKRCYPNQISKATLNLAALLYLPTELRSRDELVVCHRCKTHMSSRKKNAPSKAYWNDLDPGKIPNELQVLTEPERRLISRIIPFVKIVKFTGSYGQYGFKGQAVLFAQDIFEVSEKLPNMLPRSSDSAGMVVVTENLENLNITREFTISRDKVYKALRWLVVNNPLYKDVVIDNDAIFDENDFVLLSAAQEYEGEDGEPNANMMPKTIFDYTPINKNSRILRAAWHQGNGRIFTSGYAGIQCCAMVLANIVRAKIQEPSSWTSNVLNMNMIEGDKIYKTIRLLTNENPAAYPIDDTGYLEVRNFNVIKESFIMFNKTFFINYAVEADYWGCLNDATNVNGFGMSLRESLENLFRNHKAGLLVHNGMSFGVMHYEEKYYFTDSHSCGAKGTKAPVNGKACVIETNNIDELVRLCKRPVPVRTQVDVVYSLDFIDVHVVDGAFSNLYDNNASFDENDLVLLSAAQEDVVEEPEEEEGEHYLNVMPRTICDYTLINENLRILRATWHQGNSRIFTSGYAGIQCCAMVLANIVRAKIQEPSSWTSNVLNMNMIEGDKIYKTIRLLTNENYSQALPIEENGFLEVRNFNVIKENFIMFNKTFSINYADDADYWGCLDDAINENGFGMSLRESLENLFTNHIAGLLVHNGMSFGVMHYEEKYYFTDSHSCGAKGAKALINGKACVIETSNIDELVRLCKRPVPVRTRVDVVYSLDFIDVYVVDGAVLNEQEIVATLPQEEQMSPLPGNLVQPISILQQPYVDPIQESIAVHTSVMAPIDCIQPLEEEELEVSEHLNEIRRKTKDNIVNEAYELKAEEFAWYHLFPYGKNGLKEKRKVKISPLDYFQQRILGSDVRFQRNDYLFYALSMFEYYRVKSTISACAKKIEGKDGIVEDVHLYLKNLRGSAAYWRTALNELIAQIRCLGPPTYFITLSCNDLNWLDMRMALLIADGRHDGNPEELDIYETQKLIEQYPVVVSRHFMIRVNALMAFLKSNTSALGGRLVDYWWRIEFQNRGSPHLHMVVWIENYPSFETAEGIQKIDEACSCKMPDGDSELYEIVKKCQIHNHTHSCKKKDSTINCRFCFPRAECEETRIVAHTSEEFIKNGGRSCILKRRSEEQWINNYNPTLLGMWKGNMDIQPCGSNEAIAFYIAKYVTKSEPEHLDAGIAQAIRQIQRDPDKDISRKLFKICMRILSERQVSACECAYRLCHLNFRGSSRKCVFVNTRKPEQRYKVLRFDASNQATGYCSNIFERYEKRPVEHPNYDFNNMSLTEFAMLFEPYYAKKPEDDEECVDEDAYEVEAQSRRRLITLIDNSKMTIRNIPAVFRVPYFMLSTDPENFYYSLLLQYMPYRRECEVLDEYETAREAFLAREELLKESSKHMEIYRERDKQLENAFIQVHAFHLLEEPELVGIEEEVEEVADQQMNEDQFNLAQRAMNVGQREIFNKITSSINEQVFGQSKERERLFITGGAGTGKTFVFNLLKNQVNRCYGRVATKVGALTGVAARLVNGSTLHSLLKLPVQKDGRIVNMPHLTGNYLRIMRQQWKDIEFVFIDEISMVPYEMLCMIDSRLKQLKNNEDIFGGMNVLLFGDLMQLPPVRGNQVFNQPIWMEPATHLWRLFTLVELKENMRQQGDDTFVRVLNALRFGELTDEHMAALIQKVSDKMTGEFAIGKALRIYPTNKLVTNHNMAVLNEFRSQGMKIYKIKSQDTLVDATRNADNVDLDNVIPTDVNKTGGFPKELEIFVGAKVMLRKNIDTSKGLVNGAIGNITEIIWPLFRRDQMYEKDIPSVRIDFGRDGIHVIQPQSVQFSARYSYGTIERRMLPLILSWASTVHKMQGSTVDYAVIYLGKELFAEGQAYVALSRVRSLDGIFIEELDCTKLTGKKPCNNEALMEIERMRQIQ